MKDNVYPGEIWGANAQCQIFLLDSDAHIDHNEADFQVQFKQNIYKVFQQYRRDVLQVIYRYDYTL